VDGLDNRPITLRKRETVKEIEQRLALPMNRRYCCLGFQPVMGKPYLAVPPRLLPYIWKYRKRNRHAGLMSLQRFLNKKKDSREAHPKFFDAFENRASQEERK
jgi:hypothetical protein